MNHSMKRILQAVSFSFLANVISMVISTVVIAIVPKAIGQAEYGYYQLYLFYAAYTGFFHLGWCDGIYLRYGGIDYEDYDRPLISSQFWALTALEAVVTLGLILGVSCLGFQADKRLVLTLAALSIVFVIPKTLVSYLLQISNRIREYSCMVILEKLICFLLTVALLALGYRDYVLLIAADIAGKGAALLLGCWYCRDIVLSRMCGFSLAMKEAWQNISVGVKLLAANISSMLILGIVRFAIEDHWSIETFAKVSLAISVSNLLMLFINSVGVVLFPILKRMETESLRQIYKSLRTALMVLLFAMLACYYPLQWVLNLWLPDYAESFRYMSILFPMCVYDCKMALLINTYLKALRKERQLLWINVATVLLSCAFTYVCVYLLESVPLSMGLVVLLFAFRGTVSELLLGRYIQQSFLVENLLDVAICAIFIGISSLLPMYLAGGLYLLVYVGYVFCRRDVIRELLGNLKRMRNPS